MMDFAKEFKKKTSVNFWKRRFKNSPAEIMLCGDHPDHHGAMAPQTVMRLIDGGIAEAEYIAQEWGYKNTKRVDFYVYHQTVYRDYDPYEYCDYDPGQDLYYLIAREK